MGQSIKICLMVSVHIQVWYVGGILVDNLYEWVGRLVFSPNKTTCPCRDFGQREGFKRLYGKQFIIGGSLSVSLPKETDVIS